MSIVARLAALDTLLREHSDASVVAIARNALFVPMPPDLPLHGRPLIQGRSSMLDVVDRAQAKAVIEAWDRMIEEGDTRVSVRANEKPVDLHLIDLIETYGVIVGVLVGYDAGCPQAETPQPAPQAAVMYKDELSVIIAGDEAVTAMLGWSEAELIGRRSVDFIHPQDREYAISTWLRMLSRPGASARARLRHRHRDGSWRWLDITNHNRLADPDNRRVVADLVDVTAEVEAVSALRASERLLRRLAEALPVGVLYVEADHRISYCNSRVADIVGMPGEKLIEDQMGNVMPGDRGRMLSAVEAALTTGRDADLEISVAVPAEGLRRCLMSLRPVLNDDNEIAGAITCLSDITFETIRREELERRVRYDPLTGCLSRLSIMDELQRLLDRPHEGTWAVAVFVDLDNLKETNDRHGHDTGDRLLSHVAGQLRQAAGLDGAVGRIGGDEFLVIVRTAASEGGLAEVADRMAAALRSPVLTPGATIMPKASVGLAYASGADGSGNDALRLVAAADAAMYRSKRRRDGTPVIAYGDPASSCAS